MAEWLSLTEASAVRVRDGESLAIKGSPHLLPRVP